MRKFFIFCLFLPCLGFASLGDDLNSLLDSFFGSGQAPLVSPEEEKGKEEVLSIPDIEIVENPEEEDLELIREEIFLEESELDDFKIEIAEREEKLKTIQGEKASLTNQLFLLDSQVGLNAEKLEKFEEQEKKWKKDLDNITYEKSDLKAEMRIKQSMYERFMSKIFVQSESFGSGGDISILKWLFSDKTVSEILEERRKESLLILQKEEKLQQLNQLKKGLEAKEKQAALFYGKLYRLKSDIAQEKHTLQILADKKAHLLQGLDGEEENNLRELSNTKRQRTQSTIYLQNLRLTLKRTQDQLKEKYENPEAFEQQQKKIQAEQYVFFDSPLNIPLNITASFRDPVYKEKMGREHDGVDFLSPQGTDILAPADGIVKKVEFHNYGYSYFILQHKNGFYTVYGHVSDILVNEDQVVKQGELIAKTGGTAGTKGAGYFTSGPHLHFEVFRDGQFLDPMRYLGK
ncbi:peptidoglycan DD-metalloendopeptidase family protein [Candidatus Gracilibacteria bacterium]|nr:peptidoglycan DD-metalloendopeptidase family protein [Candidatus Gracilibacteria bacterium]